MRKQSFDELMWQYIHQTGAEAGEKSSAPAHPLDYYELENRIEALWKLLNTQKFHIVRERCEKILTNIEHDLANDFGRDIQTATLYEDRQENRRECYLETLDIYHRVLRSFVIETLLQTKTSQDIDDSFERYQTLRSDIQREISKAAYLLGRNYKDRMFITSDDLEKMDRLVREHCQFVSKSEFFKIFKIVLQTLGNLHRKNFHQVTEPYKSLRELCEKCLQILTLMKDDRFFGPHDTFIEDYERDVKIYLQILWFLGAKTDLNKIDKFLDPNTYSRGMDAHCQVFAAITLLENILPHLKEARSVGLSDLASIEILEGYAEHWYKVLTHEEEQAEKGGLQQIKETARILAKGYSPDYDQAFDLSVSRSEDATTADSYRSLEDLKHHYAGLLSQNSEIYLTQKDFREFENILEQAARGVGVKEESGTFDDEAQEQSPQKKAYRYKYIRGTRTPKPAVFVTQSQNPKEMKRMLHREWVEELYMVWKKLKKLHYMKGIIDQYTELHEKTKYRVQFAIKFLKKTPFAFRLRDHRLIKVPNPEGRILRKETTIDEILDAMKGPVFLDFIRELRLQYRSHYGLKLQALRWSWFAERKLPEGYFEEPKYNYVKYIHTRWKEKVKTHYATLRRMSHREDD